MNSQTINAIQSASENDQIAVLLLADIAPTHRLWGWSRMVQGPRALRRTDGLLFAKVLGSGYEGGFGLKPSASRQGVFALFSSLQTAHAFIDRSPLVQAYKARSQEFFSMTMQAWSCRGSWDGQSLAVAGQAPVDVPIAALTRASIRMGKAAAFWRYAPAAQSALDHTQGCQLAVGLGEAPLLRQATFTLWDSVSHMDAYARSGAHLTAIQAAAKHGYFFESMFARFSPLTLSGQWKGKHYG